MLKKPSFVKKYFIHLMKLKSAKFQGLFMFIFGISCYVLFGRSLLEDTLKTYVLVPEHLHSTLEAFDSRSLDHKQTNATNATTYIQEKAPANTTLSPAIVKAIDIAVETSLTRLLGELTLKTDLNSYEFDKDYANVINGSILENVLMSPLEKVKAILQSLLEKNHKERHSVKDVKQTLILDQEAGSCESGINCPLSKNTHVKAHQSGHKIVIMASYRSGSTFIGQIFAQMPDTFYTYEPLMYIDFNVKTKRRKVLLEEKLSFYLYNILNCNFRPLHDASLKYFSNEPYYEQKRRQWNIIFYNGRNGQSFHSVMRGTMNSCMQKRHKVTKVIRARYLKDMVELLRQNITIVNLIRDPRGTFSSRLKMEKTNPKTYAELIGKHCAKLRANIEFMLEHINKDQKLRSNFLVLRYEDFAHDPKSWSEKVFKYFGASTTRLFNWLDVITTGDNMKSYRNPHSISRDSEKTSSMWKFLLSYDTVEMIQDKCGDVLQYYGYNLIQSEEQQYNISNVLVGEMSGDIHTL